MVQTKSVIVQGKMWRYKIAGGGNSSLVVLPGALGAGNLLAKHISELLPDLHLVIPEYSPANSIAEFLDAFETILAAENVQKPIVYGGSFGGLLEQCWARRNPENIHALIIFGAPAPDANRTSTHRRMLKILPFLPMSLLRLLMKLAVFKITKDITSNKNLWRKELQSLASKIQREDLASRYNTALDFDTNFYFKPDDLGEMQILLLEGSEDRVANQKVREKMRLLYPHAEIVIIQGAGHSLLLTHPKQWQSAITKFILNRSGTH